MKAVKKHLFNVFGALCVGLGLLGVFLPLLPTTPFILLASFCFARGSDRFHGWLVSNKLFGKIIRDWEDQKVIRTRSKVLATLLMLASLYFFIWLKPLPFWAKILISILFTIILSFIITRPSRPRKAG